MALVDEALRLVEPLGPPLAAFLGGSRAFGLGNRLSDVDLTLVYDDAALTGQPRVRSLVGDDDVALHYELFGLSEYEKLCTVFASPSLKAASASVAAEVVMGNQRPIAELLYGPSLLTSPVIDEMRGRLDPDGIDTLCAAATAMMGSLSVRDAAGAAQSGDWLTAASSAEMALEYALDAALFARGDRYRSRKFLARRLSRHPDLAPYVEDLRRPLDDLERRTRDTLLLANGLQASVLLATGQVWNRRPDGAGPRRSPYVTLVVTDAGPGLAGATECGLSRPAGILWLLADGRPLPELAGLFAEVVGLPRDDTVAFIEKNVAQLHAAGAIEG